MRRDDAGFGYGLNDGDGEGANHAAARELVTGTGYGANFGCGHPDGGGAGDGTGFVDGNGTGDGYDPYTADTSFLINPSPNDLRAIVIYASILRKGAP